MVEKMLDGLTEAERAQQKKDATRCRKVEEAICRRAKGYKIALKKTYKVKRVEYDPDTGKKTSEREELEVGIDEVHVPADMRAGAYWLNNRDPERWQEHPKEMYGDHDPVGVVDLPPLSPIEAEADGDDDVSEM